MGSASLQRKQKGANGRREPVEAEDHRPCSSSSGVADRSSSKQREKPGGGTPDAGSPSQVNRGRVLLAILRNPENSPVIRKFLLFATSLAIVPVATLLLLPNCLVRLLQAAQYDSQGLEEVAKTWSCIASVVVVNLIMLLYAYLAYEEEKRDWEAVSRTGGKKTDDQRVQPESKKAR